MQIIFLSLPWYVFWKLLKILELKKVVCGHLFHRKRNKVDLFVWWHENSWKEDNMWISTITKQNHGLTFLSGLLLMWCMEYTLFGERSVLPSYCGNAMNKVIVLLLCWHKQGGLFVGWSGSVSRCRQLIV